MAENYIKRLERERDEAQARVRAACDDLAEFRAHIASPKFMGYDGEGDRKDWIATGDVNARLCNIRDTLLGLA